MRFLLFIIYPFTLIYGIVLYIRNKCYDWGICKSQAFDFPIISVGNLSMGGTGKTPHIESLITLLKNDYKIAVLSRGYKRKTKGFRLADKDSDFRQIGDEPMQIHRKFSDVIVAVDEKRSRGIMKVMEIVPQTDVVLLDDAFQHRAVKPGLSILLTDFHNLYPEDYLFPVGKLREFRRGARRADIIVITKTAKVLSPITVRRIIGLIKPREHQRVYFSYISYDTLKPLPGSDTKLPAGQINSALLFAGIANIYPLKEHVLLMTNQLDTLTFSDHHNYSGNDFRKIRTKFENILSQNKIIITTEKDAMRIAIPKIHDELAGLPIFYIPITAKIHKEFRADFNNQIKTYVQKNSGDSSVH
ncbi:MAG: tetraacyldisaccharide 4'-kinase [Bacteroidales bacterium]|nr:tetraacyldisaccharide 4'-kinase [Bacteroidales bacterium]